MTTHAERRPSETLRHAAKLMRERAEAATPGPWEYRGDFDITHGYEINEHDRPVANWVATVLTGDDDLAEAGMQDPNAAYIASMHPGVALAVAGWLDAAAGCGCEPGDDHGDLAAGALAVARACLGTEQES